MNKSKKEGAKMVTTTISLPEDVYKELKHRAVDENSNVRDLIRRAVEAMLKKGGKR